VSLEPRPARRLGALAGLGLLAAACVMILGGIGQTDLWDPDEPRIAQVTEEMRSGRHGPAGWVLLHLNREPYTEKPPLYYWLVSLASAGEEGVDAVAARLPSALAGIACVLLAAAFGARLLGARAGLLGGALLLTTWEFVYLARRAQFDVLLALLETLALVGFWRADRGLGSRGWNAALFHGAMGLAVLTKGPVGFLIPMLVTATWLTWEGRLRQMRRAVPLWGLALSLGPGLAWLGASAALAPEGFLGETVGTNLLGRFFAGTSHERPFYYYVYQLPMENLPWSLLWPLVAGVGWRRIFGPGADPERRRSWRFLLAWVGASFVFFSLSSGKRGLYLLPAFPAAALLLADALISELDARGRVPDWLGRGAAALGGLFVVAGIGVAAWPIENADVPWTFAAAVIAAVGGAALAWRALAHAAPALRLGAIAAGAAGIELAAFTVLFPALDAEKSLRPFGQAVASLTAREEPVGLVGNAQKTGTFAYYTQRRIVPLDTPAQVRSFVEGGGRLLITEREDLERLAPAGPVVLRAAEGSDEDHFVAASPRDAAPGATPGGGSASHPAGPEP